LVLLNNTIHGSFGFQSCKTVVQATGRCKGQATLVSLFRALLTCNGWPATVAIVVIITTNFIANIKTKMLLIAVSFAVNILHPDKHLPLTSTINLEDFIACRGDGTG